MGVSIYIQNYQATECKRYTVPTSAISMALDTLHFMVN